MSEAEPPVFTHEPSNRELAELITRNHHSTNKRLGDLEHHLIDPKNPNRTLPVRVKQLEGFQRVVKWAGGAIVGGSLAAIGAVLIEKIKSGSPHP